MAPLWLWALNKCEINVGLGSLRAVVQVFLRRWKKSRGLIVIRMWRDLLLTAGDDTCIRWERFTPEIHSGVNSLVCNDANDHNIVITTLYLISFVFCSFMVNVASCCMRKTKKLKKFNTLFKINKASKWNMKIISQCVSWYWYKY